MREDTETRSDGAGDRDSASGTGGKDGERRTEPRTSGHIERTVLHRLAGDDGEASTPTTVGAVSTAVGAVIDRGEYANVGPRGAASGTVRKSTIRRALAGLREKGLVARVSEMDPRAPPACVDLGDLAPDGDPADPADYAATTDDARVTDWVLTEAGREEVARLDRRYEAEMDALAARYGRPRGETTDRIDA